MTANEDVNAILQNMAAHLNLPLHDDNCAAVARRKSTVLFLLQRYHVADDSRTGAVAGAVLHLLEAQYTAPHWLLRHAQTALELIHSRTLAQIEAGSNLWEHQEQLTRIRKDQERLAAAAQNGGAL